MKTTTLINFHYVNHALGCFWSFWSYFTYFSMNTLVKSHAMPYLDVIGHPINTLRPR